MSKHTPKRWHVSHEHDGTFIRDSDGGLIASLEAGYQETRDTHGRLIAAAPDLLAALQTIKALRAGEWDNPLVAALGPLSDFATDLDRITREAITKATQP